MKYPTGQNITYTAVAKTDGYVSGDHSYLWQFDDSTTAATASTSKSWSTAATHRATVTATNTITGGTDSAFVDVVTRSLKTWTAGGDITPNRNWDTVAYGNGYYLAAAISGTTVYFARSSDGLNWDDIGNYNFTPSTPTLLRLNYGNGRFVLSCSPKMIYSLDDGVTWNISTITSRQWTSSCFNGTKFVAVAYGTSISASSTDGATWTENAMVSSKLWYAVAWNGNAFAALATNGVASSVDGVTWVDRAIPVASSDWQELAGGNGIFVGRRYNTHTQPILYSLDDGATWSLISPIASIDLRSLAYGDGLFVANSFNVGTNGSVWSTDGFTWTTMNQVESGNWSGGSVYGNGRFVCLGSGTTNISQYLDW